KVLENAALRFFLQMGGAEHSPVYRNSASMKVLGKNFLHGLGNIGVGPDGEEKFVGVNKGNVTAFVPVILNGIVVGRNLTGYPGKFPVGDDPVFYIGGKNCRHVVGAAVVIDIKMVHANQKMIFEPFLHIGGLIFHNGSYGKLVGKLRRAGTGSGLQGVYAPFT